MKKILFICLGNICRSCTAQTIFQHMVDEAGLHEQYDIDSAGLIDYHEGERADSRMRHHAQRHGYHITHLSRPIMPQDFQYYDLIIGMDKLNIQRLRKLAPDAQCAAKIHLILEWSDQYRAVKYVPDPYYGTDKDFEIVITLLKDACQGLLQDTLPSSIQ